MTHQTEPTWAVLRKAGIVQGPMPETSRQESPWFVKSLLAFCSWLAALFLLGAIGIGLESIFRNRALVGAFGVALMGGAFSTLRVRRNVFVEHLALATSLAGQVMVAYALFVRSGHSDTAPWLIVALMQTTLAVIMPSFVHRVFSSTAAAVAFTVAAASMGWPPVIDAGIMLLAAMCWLDEFRYPQHIRKIGAAGYGLTLALLLLQSKAFGPMKWFFYSHSPTSWTSPWLADITMGAVSLYVVVQLLRRYHRAFSDPIAIFALLGTLAVGVAALAVKGLTVGMLIVLLGFFGANRILLATGIVALLFYIVSYYYWLDTTLLNKSWALLVVGLVLLAVRWLMLRIQPEKSGGAAC